MPTIYTPRAGAFACPVRAGVSVVAHMRQVLTGPLWSLRPDQAKAALAALDAIEAAPNSTVALSADQRAALLELAGGLTGPAANGALAVAIWESEP